MKKVLLDEEYCCEALCDVERDVYEAIEDCDGEVDEYGFTKGTYKVTITYTEE
jgi:hypothetical protein